MFSGEHPFKPGWLISTGISGSSFTRCTVQYSTVQYSTVQLFTSELLYLHIPVQHVKLLPDIPVEMSQPGLKGCSPENTLSNLAGSFLQEYLVVALHAVQYSTVQYSTVQYSYLLVNYSTYTSQYSM